MATFKVDASSLSDKLLSMQQKADIAMMMYAQQGAQQFENYAKNNRPWTDRTGHARQRLSGYVEKNPDNIRIYISHGVEYGFWLEYSHEKRFAILQKTINAISPMVIKGFDKLIEKISQ